MCGGGACCVQLREGRYFEPILNYMRTGELLIPPSMPKSAVLAEADFYCITPGAPCLPFQRACCFAVHHAYGRERAGD